jgi:hypothetical protein
VGADVCAWTAVDTETGVPGAMDPVDTHGHGLEIYGSGLFLKSRSHSRNAGLLVLSKRLAGEASWPSSSLAPMCPAVAVLGDGE